MNTFPVLLGALCIYAIGYRFYSAFIAAKALALDDRRTTPAHMYPDGCFSDTTSPRLPERALWSGRHWQRSLGLLQDFYGC